MSCFRNICGWMWSVYYGDPVEPPAPPLGPLIITYADFFPLPQFITDIESLSEWNTKVGGNYTSLVVDYDNFIITLDGGDNVTIPNGSFFGDTLLISIQDTGSSVVAVADGGLADNGFSTLLTLIDLPYCLTIGSDALKLSFATEVRLDRCTTAGNEAFQEAYATTYYLPELTTIGTSCWYQHQGIVNLDLPKLIIMEDNSFQNCFTLETINLPACTYFDNDSFNNCTAMTTCTAPLVEFIGVNGLANCTVLDNVNFPVCETLEDACFLNCTTLQTYNLPAVTSIGVGVFENCTSLLDLSFALVTLLGEDVIKNSASVTTVDCPLVTSVQALTFDLATGLTLINLPLCTDLGGSPLDNGVFGSIAGNTITLNIAAVNETNNAGNPDGDIQYLVANNTVTVNYI